MGLLHFPDRDGQVLAQMSKIGMPQQVLDLNRPGTAPKHVGGAGTTHGMRANDRLDSGELTLPEEYVADTLRRERTILPLS